jgi:hypothetical protein
MLRLGYFPALAVSGESKMGHGKFGTAINCMDGRAQLPLINWMKDKYHLDYVDMITEPGPDGIMAKKTSAIESIKSRILVSINAHGSNLIVIAGHYDCAGNPVSPQEHQKHIREAIKLARSWKLPVTEITGVWLNESWEVEVIEA